jgi:hypothetical protein
VAPRSRQRRGELGSAVECVGPLPCLDLGERLDHLHAVLGREYGAPLALGIQSYLSL